ncbi:ribonuclease H-like domain-containing protein [Tanacetum coccineum]
MTGLNSQAPNIKGATSTVSSNTTNALLLKLIGQLGSFGVNDSNGGNFGVNGNTHSNGMGDTKPVVAYHTFHSPYITTPVQPTTPAAPAQLTMTTQPVGTMGPTGISGQATTLPHVFNAVTFQDAANGAWNMDTENGSTQLEGVDVDETLSAVVKLGTIRTVLSLAASRHWPTHQLDVKNAFLHGDLSETVYMHQPLGFRDFVHPDYVCLLQRQETDTAYLLLYVDDIVLTASFESLLQQIIGSLHKEFAMTDLGSLNYFLGISVTRDSSGFFLSQKKYASEILERSHMVNCNPSRNPGTLNYGLQLFSSSTIDFFAYSDADWAGCPTTRRSTSGYCVFLGNNLLSWCFKRQPTLSRSSAEVEYHGVANNVAETCWIRNLLCGLHSLLSSATLVHVLHVLSHYQFADIFTKGLPLALFEEFQSSLSIWCALAPTAGECTFVGWLEAGVISEVVLGAMLKAFRG